MHKVKALVVLHDEDTRLEVDDVLSTLNHPYELAGDLAAARKLLPVGGYTYVLLDYRLPSRPGGLPREQNAQYVLAELSEMTGDAMPPVVVIADERPVMSQEDMIRWAADMTERGATDFICRPLPTGGRTLDNVIGKVLKGGGTRRKRPVSVPRGQGGPVADFNSSEQGGMGEYESVPNDPVTLDEFMAKFCEYRSKENRKCRKRALLAAARHKTVTLPPLALTRKIGQANRYFPRDLLAAWQGFLDEGVDVPPLKA